MARAINNSRITRVGLGLLCLRKHAAGARPYSLMRLTRSASNNAFPTFLYKLPATHFSTMLKSQVLTDYVSRGKCYSDYVTLVISRSVCIFKVNTINPVIMCNLWYLVNVDFNTVVYILNSACNFWF